MLFQIQVQQARFHRISYEFDVIRNVSTRLNDPHHTSDIKRASIPVAWLSTSKSVYNAAAGEEEEQAIAGRLEIRVVNGTGGATIVQTSTDKEPLQSMPYFNLEYKFHTFYQYNRCS